MSKFSQYNFFPTQQCSHNSSRKIENRNEQGLIKMTNMSTTSEEEQSLFTNNPVISYTNLNDDPFTFKLNQQTKNKVSIGEHSPAYAILKERNLLLSAYRKQRFNDIFTDEDLSPNSSLSRNFAKKWKWGKTNNSMIFFLHFFKF